MIKPALAAALCLTLAPLASAAPETKGTEQPATVILPTAGGTQVVAPAAPQAPLTPAQLDVPGPQSEEPAASPAAAENAFLRPGEQAPESHPAAGHGLSDEGSADARQEALLREAAADARAEMMAGRHLFDNENRKPQGSPLAVIADRSFPAPDRPDMAWRHLWVSLGSKRAAAAYDTAFESLKKEGLEAPGIWGFHDVAKPGLGRQEITLLGEHAAINSFAAKIHDLVAAINAAEARRAKRIKADILGLLSAVAVTAGLAPLAAAIAGVALTPMIALATATGVGGAFFWYRSYSRQRAAAPRREEFFNIIQDVILLPGIALGSLAGGVYTHHVLTASAVGRVDLVVPLLGFFGGIVGALSFIPEVAGDYSEPHFLAMVASMVVSSGFVIALGEPVAGVIGLLSLWIIHRGVAVSKTLSGLRYGSAGWTKPEEQFRQGVVGLNVALPALALALAHAWPTAAFAAWTGVVVSALWAGYGVSRGAGSIPAAEKAWAAEMDRARRQAAGEKSAEPAPSPAQPAPSRRPWLAAALGALAALAAAALAASLGWFSPTIGAALGVATAISVAARVVLFLYKEDMSGPPFLTSAPGALGAGLALGMGLFSALALGFLLGGFAGIMLLGQGPVAAAAVAAAGAVMGVAISGMISRGTPASTAPQAAPVPTPPAQTPAQAPAPRPTVTPGMQAAWDAAMKDVEAAASGARENAANPVGLVMIEQVDKILAEFTRASKTATREQANQMSRKLDWFVGLKTMPPAQARRLRNLKTALDDFEADRTPTVMIDPVTIEDHPFDRLGLADGNVALGSSVSRAFAQAMDLELFKLDDGERMEMLGLLARAAYWGSPLGVPAELGRRLVRENQSTLFWGDMGSYALDKLAAIGTSEALAHVALQRTNGVRISDESLVVLWNKAGHLLEAADSKMAVAAIELAEKALKTAPYSDKDNDWRARELATRLAEAKLRFAAAV